MLYRGNEESRKLIRSYDWLAPASIAAITASAASQSSVVAPKKRGGKARVKSESADASDESSTSSSSAAAAGASASASSQALRYKFHVLCTSYEFAVRDFSVFKAVPWSVVVVDEAQRLKNAESALYKQLNALACTCRQLLTGTPIQNSIEELWALLHFIAPAAFPLVKKPAFVETYGALTTVERVTELSAELRPYLLRRLKTDVEQKLPPKEECLIYVDLTRMYARALQTCAGARMHLFHSLLCVVTDTKTVRRSTTKQFTTRIWLLSLRRTSAQASPKPVF